MESQEALDLSDDRVLRTDPLTEFARFHFGRNPSGTFDFFDLSDRERKEIDLVEGVLEVVEGGAPLGGLRKGDKFAGNAMCQNRRIGCADVEFESRRESWRLLTPMGYRQMDSCHFLTRLGEI
jgi:hypothetical protein